jgi:hypothetical protein
MADPFPRWAGRRIMTFANVTAQVIAERPQGHPSTYPTRPRTANTAVAARQCVSTIAWRRPAVAVKLHDPNPHARGRDTTAVRRRPNIPPRAGRAGCRGIGRGRPYSIHRNGPTISVGSGVGRDASSSAAAGRVTGRTWDAGYICDSFPVLAGSIL